jgi:hypothetical protein
MRSVTVLNDMPTDPIINAVGCLSRGGNCRHGPPPSELRGRSRDKPTTALTLELKLQATKYFRLEAQGQATSSPFPRRIRNAQTVSRVPDLCD